MNEVRPKFLFVISLGRSGSTFFGHRFSALGGFHYFGEKRFLWSSLASFPVLGKYLLKRNIKKNKDGSVILDKTTYMHKYLESIAPFIDIVGIILLERDVAAIEKSAVKMEKEGSNFTRLRMRVNKYISEYGVFAIFALLTRVHLLANVFGLKTGMFGRSMFGGSLGDEVDVMLRETRRFADTEGIPLVRIAYESFQDDCVGLARLGVSETVISAMQAEFIPRK